MNRDVYATNKAIFHPEIVSALSEHKSYELNPTLVHLMLQNTCNQNCHFCSYRLDNWKNSQDFDTTAYIPWNKLQEILNDLEEMKVKAILMTGGGEPLAYPNIKDCLKRLSNLNMEIALQTNGILLKDDVVDLLFKTKLKWVRVSIDSGCKETYIKVRRVPNNHWDKVWKNIKKLITHRTDQVIGIGFVVTDWNYKEVYQLCHLAKDIGVDNVRISMAFTPKGAMLLSKNEIKTVNQQIKKAKKDFEDENFTIPDTFEDRVYNITQSPFQDYDYCPVKDIVCVIEGSQKVYTCCMLTGTPLGEMGSLINKRFKNLWKEKEEWRKNFNVRKNCQCSCLYEQRNKEMLTLMQKPKHINFI